MAGRTRSQNVRWSVGVLLAFWGLAFLVALNDIDFFTLEDLFDTSAPHHEHIVVALILIGIVAAIVSLLRGRQRTPRV